MDHVKFTSTIAVVIAQLVRAVVLWAAGRGFDPLLQHFAPKEEIYYVCSDLRGRRARNNLITFNHLSLSLSLSLSLVLSFDEKH